LLQLAISPLLYQANRLAHLGFDMFEDPPAKASQDTNRAELSNATPFFTIQGLTPKGLDP